MSLGEIEAELENLTADELRRLAMKSWTTFMKREGHGHSADLCDENDPKLLTALDEALAIANDSQGQGISGDEVFK